MVTRLFGTLPSKASSSYPFGQPARSLKILPYEASSSYPLGQPPRSSLKVLSSSSSSSSSRCVPVLTVLTTPASLRRSLLLVLFFLTDTRFLPDSVLDSDETVLECLRPQDGSDLFLCDATLTPTSAIVIDVIRLRAMLRKTVRETAKIGA